MSKADIAARLRLIQMLNQLHPTQFEALALALNPPSGILPPNFAAQGNRTSDLLRWVESPTGPGLSVLKDTLSLVTGTALESMETSSQPGNIPSNANTQMSGMSGVEPLAGQKTPADILATIVLTKLTGEQFVQLGEAMKSAFPDKAKLSRMVRITFDQRLQEVAEGANHTERVDQLIDWADSEGRLLELVVGASRQNPGNRKLQDFIASLVPDTQVNAARRVNSQGPAFDWRGPTDERELEGLLRPQRDVTSYDMAFIQRASQPAAAVCRIELPNQEAIGTGFLIAKNLVLTNYHVIAPYEDSAPGALLDQIILRFGYLTTASGQGAAGQVFRLSTNPLRRFQTVEQGLDYAVLEVEEGIVSVPELQPIALRQSRLPHRDMNIHILQHPEGQTLRVTFSNNGITGVYERDGLIQYVSDTAVGSSGSPCFNDNWELVAVHHAQVPATFGVKCEGILFQAIYQDISDIL